MKKISIEKKKEYKKLYDQGKISFKKMVRLSWGLSNRKVELPKNSIKIDRNIKTNQFKKEDKMY